MPSLWGVLSPLPVLLLSKELAYTSASSLLVELGSVIINIGDPSHLMEPAIDHIRT